MDSAALTADGPGTGVVLCPDLTASRTISLPGSEIPGVPASETRTVSPFSRKFTACNVQILTVVNAHVLK